MHLQSFMASNSYLMHVMSIKINGMVQMKYLLIISINHKIIESLIGTTDFNFSIM